MVESLEFKVKYPAFRLRRYGVVLTGPDDRHNKPFIPPSAAFMGRVLAETPAALEQMAKRWQAEYDEAHVGYQPKIDLDRKYLVWVTEDDQLKRRRRRLQELTPQDLVLNVKERIQQRFKSKNLWEVGGREAFDLIDGNGHIGNLVLSFKVKSKGRGGTRGTPKYYDCRIAGAMRGAAMPFGKLIDTCGDFSFTFAKQGYEGIELVDTHMFAGLYYANRNPEEFRNAKAVQRSRGEDLQFWLPFHADAPQVTKYVTPAMRRGRQPDFGHLTFDVLLDVLFNNRPLAEIDKALADVPVIFDPWLVQLLERGDAAFEAIVHEYPYEVGKLLPTPVRTQFGDMRTALARRQFAMSGYVLEQAGTPEECVALEFRRSTGRGWESVRWIANGEPPVYIKRVSDRLGRVDLFAESQAEPASPFAKLFKPTRTWDDRTRRVTFIEYRLPIEAPIPPALLDDYRAAIAAHFISSRPRAVRGLKGLEEQVGYRNSLVVRQGMPAVPLSREQMRNLYQLTRG